MSDFDMQNITREELLARYAAGERDFRGIILQYISLDGVKLEEVDFTGAIFNAVSFESVPVAIEDTYRVEQTIFTNCNFSCSEWWFCCYIPKLIGCNLQFAVMEGCCFGPKFVDCDWKNGQIIGAYFDEFIFEDCDLRNMRRSSGFHIVPEYINQNWTILYRNTFDENGVFRDGIHCNLPDPDDIIPF
ncbi:putative Pentapeptide repeat family protein [Hyella patelloides LEGE 07179]|uniref:Putative Pentapeptide repeat family protein n=1 Tax=Hyella patelloides LEGE 07179 TaxID=945734 RepID=A0A563W2Y8_9CYAN|nr:pentapeptide repeat-containing protein [Hyella patelloides]VEP17903.1 putative Pentapeptide repeat family protein [Hyella patelloides LEGE 07179]